jgi:hypothetical protein
MLLHATLVDVDERCTGAVHRMLDRQASITELPDIDDLLHDDRADRADRADRGTGGTAESW